MSETKTLHFTVGADMGIRLMEIANEHILYTNDLDKAMKVYSESFGGEVPEEIIKDLLLGTSIVTVDEEEQMFNVVPRANHMHLDNIYPAVLNIEKFVAEKEAELIEHCERLDEGLDKITDTFRHKNIYSLDITVKTMMKYIYGQDEEFIADIMDEMEYNDDVQQMKILIRITKDFIEKSVKLSQMISRLGDMFDVKTQFYTYDLTNLAQKVQQIARAEFITFTEGEDNVLNAYMTASKEIDATISKGMLPVDIMDNYSAGWLSPEGDYYALNGEIANMLHTQIADALQEQGIIPKYENDRDKEVGIEINPDTWLEQQGWVKIHDNNVQFAGNLNNVVDEENVNVYMTDVQKKIIFEYITGCHQSIILLGWQRKRYSGGMFFGMDKIALHKHFEF